MPGNREHLPEWERLLSSAARLQQILPGAVLVGGTAAAIPIGTTYNYSFWTEPDHIIEAALEREMSLLKAMGGNAIRTYVGITPKWVRHIYERYGIFTILNHAMARYGITVDGVFSANTDYSDPRARAQVMAEIEEMVDDFKDTPGLLMWLLGNENNYGLVWSSAETEDLPEGEANAVRARHMYSLFGDVARSIKEMDPTRHPGGGARAEPRLPELPRLRQDAVLLCGPDGAACEEHARDRLVQHPGRRPHEPHRRDLLREPGPSAAA